MMARKGMDRRKSTCGGTEVTESVHHWNCEEFSTVGVCYPWERWGREVSTGTEK